jgi:hypothetical protein
MLFDRTFTFEGKNLLYADDLGSWDFVLDMDAAADAPVNWVSPTPYAYGIARVRYEVLELAPLGNPINIGIGWENFENDPQIRHTAIAIASTTGVFINKPGVYESVIRPVNLIPAYFGAGANKDKECYDWDWSHAWAKDLFYGFYIPMKNPEGNNGLPCKVHMTVSIGL